MSRGPSCSFSTIRSMRRTIAIAVGTIVGFFAGFVTAAAIEGLRARGAHNVSSALQPHLLIDAEPAVGLRIDWALRPGRPLVLIPISSADLDALLLAGQLRHARPPGEERVPGAAPLGLGSDGDDAAWAEMVELLDGRGRTHEWYPRARVLILYE